MLPKRASLSPVPRTALVVSSPATCSLPRPGPAAVAAVSARRPPTLARHVATSPQLRRGGAGGSGGAACAGLLSARAWPRPLPLSPASARQVRGKKTKTSVSLDDLPQGLVASPPRPDLPELDDGPPAYPTVVAQARRNMQKFDDCVLLTRVGGFYELYFEHAEEYGPLLNLKVAQKKTNSGSVPMAGFPFFQLDRFLKILVQDVGRQVAIAEEFPNNAADKVKSGGLMHDRRVARIITPGTLIDENFMDPYSNNYVMSIYVSAQGAPADGAAAELAGEAKDSKAKGSAAAVDDVASQSLGLAWLDLSTGHFSTQATSLPSLSSILSRVCPREVVLDAELGSLQKDKLIAILTEDRYTIAYSSQGGLKSLEDWSPMLEAKVPSQVAETFTGDEIQAGSLLLHYVKDRLQGAAMQLQPPVRHDRRQTMVIDKHTMRSLEIKQTIRDGTFRGSLLHAIRRTVTQSGARLLNEWLSAPSTSLDVIGERQDLVERFVRDEELRDIFILLLKKTYDSKRLVQKFALGRGDSDDLLALKKTIRTTEDIKKLLGREVARQDRDVHPFWRIRGRIDLAGPLKLARAIQEAIDEEGVNEQHYQEDSQAGEMVAFAEDVVEKSVSGRRAAKPTSIRDYYGEDSAPWIMKPTASPVLERLHAELAALLDAKETLAQALRDRLGATSLTLRWSPGLGHTCHVKGRDARLADGGGGHLAELRPVSASRTTRSFHHPDWAALGQRLDQARLSVRAEEARVSAALRTHVVANLVRLRRNAAVLDELDVAASFAVLACERGFVRPALDTSAAHAVVGGRHPTVEGGLAGAGRATFVRNDCAVGAPGHGRLWLVTGPNMAGKSTFLRQNALLTILAQTGCFVPADYARLGLVDAVFSRVGSADNLSHDQSTFLVEMLETAHILREATPRSFVIMDEIGRGTTPADGTAVAFAALHHLVTVNRCRTLFATHFHDLADLVVERGLQVGNGKDGAVEMYCTDVEEDGDGGFFYVHKLRKGVNRQSHALKAARLAGLPEPAVRVAQEILERSGRLRIESREREVTDIKAEESRKELRQAG